MSVQIGNVQGNVSNVIISGGDVVVSHGGRTQQQMTVELRKRIIEAMQRLNLYSAYNQRAFIMSMMPDRQFELSLSYDSSLSGFCPTLVCRCEEYGTFETGQPALIALVESISKRGGLSIQRECAEILSILYQQYGIEEQKMPIVEEKEEKQIMEMVSEYIIKKVTFAEIDSAALEHHVTKALSVIDDVNVIQKNGETLLVVGGKQLAINDEFLEKLRAFVIGKKVKVYPTIEKVNHRATWDIIKSLGLLESMEVELVPAGIEDIFN